MATAMPFIQETDLDLHFEMFPEVLQESEEKGERKLEDLGNGGNSIFRQRHAKILLDGADEHVVRLRSLGSECFRKWVVGELQVSVWAIFTLGLQQDSRIVVKY